MKKFPEEHQIYSSLKEVGIGLALVLITYFAILYLIVRISGETSEVLHWLFVSELCILILTGILFIYVKKIYVVFLLRGITWIGFLPCLLIGAILFISTNRVLWLLLTIVSLTVTGFQYQRKYKIILKELYQSKGKLAAKLQNNSEFDITGPLTDFDVLKERERIKQSKQYWLYLIAGLIGQAISRYFGDRGVIFFVILGMFLPYIAAEAVMYPFAMANTIKTIENESGKTMFVLLDSWKNRGKQV